MRALYIVFLLSFFVEAAYLRPVSLEIYQNGSFLSEEVFLDANESAVNIDVKTPLYVNLDDISINPAKDCKIEDFMFKTQENFNDELQKEIEELKDKIASIANQIESLKMNNKFLESLSLSKIDGDFKDIKELSLFHQKRLFENLDKISKLQKEKARLSLKLRELEQKRSGDSYNVFALSLFCKKGVKKAAKIKYPVNVVKRRSYNIFADSKEKSVLIESLFVITQKSGKDLKNITLILSSSPKFRRISPAPFRPWYLEVLKSMPMAKRTLREDKILSMEASLPIPKISYERGFAGEFYKVSHIDLKNGESKSVVLAKDSYKAKRYTQIDGYGYAKPFIVFEFDSDKFYNPSKARLYLDNFYIGSSYFEVKNKKSKKLYFGEDLNIKVDKKLVKDFSKEPIFSANKVKTTKIWKYEIKNDHKNSMRVLLIERSPVSKTQDIEVEVIAKPKYNYLEKNGKTVWDFVLSSKEKKEIEFGYSIEKPK
ncbi:MAG: DUF4139 domain-containing protein [Epsilonproteobacteria bacterium]|nr:DUF4139 domain-containing protein [Campylobacterota bacterium]